MGNEGAAVNLFSLLPKCMQQDDEKLKPIICSIGNGCGASTTFISCENLCLFWRSNECAICASSCGCTMTALWLHSATYIVLCMQIFWITASHCSLGGRVKILLVILYSTYVNLRCCVSLPVGWKQTCKVHSIFIIIKHWKPWLIVLSVYDFF